MKWVIRGVSFEGDPACLLGIHSCACWARYPDLGCLGNSERAKSLVVLLAGKRLGKLESLMAEDHKGYVQNRAISLFSLFFRALYNSSLGLWWFYSYKMAPSRFLGTGHGRARGWAEVPKPSWGRAPPGFQHLCLCSARNWSVGRKNVEPR